MGRTIVILLLLTVGWLVVRALIGRARVETERRKALERELREEREKKDRPDPRSVRDARYRDIESPDKRNT